MSGGDRPWDQATDDALVERLVTGMQRAAVVAVTGEDERAGDVGPPAPEAATALLNLLASILEPAPECRTPMGMRKVAEAAGKERLVLMRGCRALTRPADGDAIH